MTTETKIREAFENTPRCVSDGDFGSFEAGFLAAMASLEQVGYAYCYQGQEICLSTEPQDPSIPVSYYWQEHIYRIKEQP